MLFLLYYVLAFAAVFVLRHREPTLPRPYKASGYLFSTGLVLLASVEFLIAALAQNPRSGLIAAASLAGCAPLCLRMAYSRRLRVALAPV